MRGFGQLTLRCTALAGLAVLLGGAAGCGDAKPELARPESQAKFLAVVDHYAEEYARQDNELRKSAVVRQREAQVAEIMADGHVRDWVGTIDELGTTGEGKAFVSIRLSRRASVMTWNNVVSDLAHQTLIAADSPLYARLADLSEGDEVVFSGEILAEASMTEAGGIEEPELILRFADIRSFDAAATASAEPGALSTAALERAQAEWTRVQPSQQRRYLETLDRYAQEYTAQPNELKKSNVKRARQAELAKILPSGAVEDWIGVLDGLATTSEGHAYIEVRMSDRAWAKTWNNALSDMLDKTLIQASSPLYARLAELETGTPIAFSGRILREASLTEAGSMDMPELLVRFSEVRVLTDASGARVTTAPLGARSSSVQAELERLTRQVGATPGELPDAEALERTGKLTPSRATPVEKATQPAGARPNAQRVSTPEPAREAAPVKPDRTLSCSERRELWMQQGKPEWLIRESLQSLGCPAS